MERLHLALVLLIFTSGCLGLGGVSAAEKSVEDVTLTEGEVTGLSAGDSLVTQSLQKQETDEEETTQEDGTDGDRESVTRENRSREDNQTSGEENQTEGEAEIEANITKELSLPKGLETEEANFDMGDLEGLQEKGIYYVKADGETVMMLAIGKLDTEERAQSHYDNMSSHVTESMTEDMPERAQRYVNVTEDMDILDIAEECTAATHDVRMEYNPPSKEELRERFDEPDYNESDYNRSKYEDEDDDDYNESYEGSYSESSENYTYSEEERQRYREKYGEELPEEQQFEAPEGFRPTQTGENSYEFKIHIGMCQKSVFLIGMMQRGDTSPDNYMKPVARSVLNKI